MGRADLAEPAYEEALDLYRGQNPTALELANAVRGMAILKDETGQREEAERLWQEAHDLYVVANVPPGVAESARRLDRLRSNL